MNLDRLIEIENLHNSINIAEIEDLSIALRIILERYLHRINLINKSDAVKIQAVIDYLYEQINIGNWREVKKCLRKAVTISSYFRLISHLKSVTSMADSELKEAYKIVDFGLIFGCPLNSNPSLLQKCANFVDSLRNSTDCDNLIERPMKLENFVNKCDKFNAVPLDVVDCPSMESFYKNYMLKETPVVIENCINFWPALSKWKDQNYLLKLAGFRTISIEVGNKYTDEDWTQKLMTLEEFINEHIYNCNGPVGYLAQYHLFDQIPELRKDISEPDYCCFSESDNPVEVMAWYGPKGTISPLHHDPKKNLLAQVVGEKQLFLFSPKDSEFLYPHEHELLNNTARVDPREPDLETFPNYDKTTPYYCHLKPGQIIYIPPKWWHFVESLSVSFSVSFWWE